MYSRPSDEVRKYAQSNRWRFMQGRTGDSSNYAAPAKCAGTTETRGFAKNDSLLQNDAAGNLAALASRLGRFFLVSRTFLPRRA